ncbi:MAG: hypothetical protein M1821_000542 [Bathelium mastoideum]|nr:MAG: hypothetical protein M1821_000542 [Bathelium mastoideum]
MAAPDTVDAKPLPPSPPAPQVEAKIVEDKQRLRSNLDLVNECDNFPSPETDLQTYNDRIATLYSLRLSASSPTLGYVLPFVAETLRGVPNWVLDDDLALLILDLPVHPASSADVKTEPGSIHATAAQRSAIIASTTAAMRATGAFAVLKGWRDELYNVYGAQGELLFEIERAASPLFGVVTYGAHMTAYVRGDRSLQEQEDRGIRIWVPRRARSKQTYGGMLDNTVAGGIAVGETPRECLVREAEEEASMQPELVKRARPVGIVSYYHVRDKRAGGEAGLLQPECQFVYDLELEEEDRLELKPSDNEVDEFTLMEVAKVKEAMARGEFKPNCALVLLDFFVRHGLLGFDNEDNYFEIVSRLHRRLEFPIWRGGQQRPAG